MISCPFHPLLLTLLQKQSPFCFLDIPSPLPTLLPFARAVVSAFSSPGLSHGSFSIFFTLRLHHIAFFSRQKKNQSIFSRKEYNMIHELTTFWKGLGIALSWAFKSDSKNTTPKLAHSTCLIRKLGNQKATVPVAGFRVVPL